MAVVTLPRCSGFYWQQKAANTSDGSNTCSDTRHKDKAVNVNKPELQPDVRYLAHHDGIWGQCAFMLLILPRCLTASFTQRDTWPCCTFPLMSKAIETQP